MKKFLVLALGGLLLSACTGAVEQQSQAKNANETAPYPAAEQGYNRSVIYLPPIKNEQNAKVELMIGKEMLVDCNVHRLSGSVKTEELKGWGYQYYVVDQVSSGISTMMACPPNYENKMEFVTINNNLEPLPYNSRLPIVVYAPADVKVKYQIWSAENSAKDAVIE